MSLGRIANIRCHLYNLLNVTEDEWIAITRALYEAHRYGEEEGITQQKYDDTTKIIKWLEERLCEHCTTDETTELINEFKQIMGN